MEAQTIINLAIGFGGTLVGLILRAMWDAIREGQKSQTALQTEIANNYVRRDDFAAFTNKMESWMQRIYDKIDTKVDRE